METLKAFYYMAIIAIGTGIISYLCLSIIKFIIKMIEK